MGIFNLGRGTGRIGAILLQNGVMIFDGTTAPVDGASGTGAGKANPGSWYFRTNGDAFVNVGTRAVPVWTSGSGPAAANGLSGLGIARAQFNPTLTTGMRTIAAHGLGVTIPALAVVVGGFMQVNTLFTSAGANAGTIAISVESAGDIQAAAACSGAPWSSTGLKAIVPKANTPESTGIAVSVAREITATVVGQALTAGKVTIELHYVMGA